MFPFQLLELDAIFGREVRVVVPEGLCIGRGSNRRVRVGEDSPETSVAVSSEAVPVLPLGSIPPCLPDCPHRPARTGYLSGEPSQAVPHIPAHVRHLGSRSTL